MGIALKPPNNTPDELQFSCFNTAFLGVVSFQLTAESQRIFLPRLNHPPSKTSARWESQDDGILFGDPLVAPMERLELTDVRDVRMSAGTLEGGGKHTPVGLMKKIGYHLVSPKVEWVFAPLHISVISQQIFFFEFCLMTILCTWSMNPFIYTFLEKLDRLRSIQA